MIAAKDLTRSLGGRVYYARSKVRGRTLKAFGEAVAKAEGRPKPYDPMTVSRWERNETIPALPTLAAIAKEGPVRKEWLAFNEGEPA